MTTNDRQDELHTYLERVRPMFHRLFNIAHAVCGNADRAEYSMRSAMLDCWTAGEASAGNHGLRESLRRSTVAAAIEDAENASDCDWDGLGEIEGDALSAFIAQEGNLMRRAIALRYGCGLSPRRIAKLLGSATKQVRNSLEGFETRVTRDFKLRNPSQALQRTVLNQLSRPVAAAPEIAGVFRTFHSDAADLPVSRHLPARIFRIVITVLLAAICIGGFFLTAVLLQPEGEIHTRTDNAVIELID